MDKGLEQRYSVEGILSEKEQERDEFGVNSYIKTDHEDSDVVCDLVSAE